MTNVMTARDSAVPPNRDVRITKMTAPSNVPATRIEDLPRDPSTYGWTMATVVNSSHLAFSSSQYCQTKAQTENSVAMRMAKVNLTESVRRFSFMMVLNLKARGTSPPSSATAMFSEFSRAASSRTISFTDAMIARSAPRFL